MNKPSSRRHLLVVDDSLETLEVLQRNLSSKGYLVHTAPSVEAALEILETESIDLVITDYRMPRVTGSRL